mmetsp:Transcript_539/g.703  ORF Transcript_539/g.703 Transcript_539/m.703 type:complete len:99 (-) Transcript_539:520-816(-)
MGLGLSLSSSFLFVRDGVDADDEMGTVDGGGGDDGGGGGDDDGNFFFSDGEAFRGGGEVMVAAAGASKVWFGGFKGTEVDLRNMRGGGKELPSFGKGD